MDIPWCSFFKTVRSLMAILASVVVAVFLIFLDPILSLRLEALGMSEDNVGLGFALMALTYVIGCMVVAGVAEKLDARAIITVGFVLSSVAVFLASGAPTQGLIQTFIGLGILGFSCAGALPTAVPEVTGAMTRRILAEQEAKHATVRTYDGDNKGPLIEGRWGSDVNASGRETKGVSVVDPSFLLSKADVVRKSNLSDKAAALVNISFMVGSTFGPVLGGGLYDSIGFTKGCILMCFLALAWGGIYCLTVTGCSRTS